MHVISPARYKPRRERRRTWPKIASVVLIVVLIGAINYLRPLPAPTASLTVTMPASTLPVTIAWPTSGQAAAAAAGYGLLGTSGANTPVATASLVKVITALCVLQKLPLTPDQGGPTYTVSSADVALYQNYVNQDGSVMMVEQGEQLTEYQALQALLIPSANNIADSLVRWVFGSQQAYQAYATSFLQAHNLDQTHIGSDASGFDPSTTSTASDMTQIGLLALKSPTLMQIADQPSATFPVAGTLMNYDTALGQAGITGLKTGNSDADGGAFLFTATSRIGGKDVQLTGAVMDASDLNSALQSAVQLSSSLQKDFEQVTIAAQNQRVGTLSTAWGTTIAIRAAAPLQLIRWKTTPLTETHQFVATATHGKVGQLTVAAGQAKSQVTLVLEHSVAGPSWWWRLTRH